MVGSHNYSFGILLFAKLFRWFVKVELVGFLQYFLLINETFLCLFDVSLLICSVFFDLLGTLQFKAYPATSTGDERQKDDE